MAKLATTLSKLEDVPEALREYYEPVDATDASAGFQLSTDDSTSRSKLSEFRQNNVHLVEKMKVLEAKLGALDGPEGRLAGLDKLVAAARSAEEEKALKSGDIESVVQRRTAEALAGADSKFKALESVHHELTNERDGLRQRVGRGAVRDAVMSALDESKVRIRPGAVDDVLRRAHETWSMNGDEHLVAQRGGETIYGEGGQPLAMPEFVSKLTNEAPYFFESGQGGGSPGNRGRVADTRGKRVVDLSDPLAIGRNLDALLKKDAVLSIESE